jgi:hypothetical protein
MSILGPAVLTRRLGPFDAAAIIVSNVIGGGILFTPPQVAESVPNPTWFLATWAVGGALAFAGAMAYAELATVRPKAGGEYVYLDAAFGRLAAFLTGWTSFVGGFLRRDRRRRRRLRVVSRTIRAGRVRRDAAAGAADPARTADDFSTGPRGARGHRGDGVDSRTRRRPRPHCRECARRGEGVDDRRRTCSRPPAMCRRRRGCSLSCR